MEIDPKDGSIMPRLSTSWKQTDSLTWEFKIRKGVKFHDGTSLNAKSVIKDKIVSQIKLDIPTYTKDNLPENLSSIKAVKPGSRNL